MINMIIAAAPKGWKAEELEPFYLKKKKKNRRSTLCQVLPLLVFNVQCRSWDKAQLRMAVKEAC